MLTLLHNVNSPETAYSVQDYPYGSGLRTECRWWLETAVKGAAKGQMRVMQQTRNPRKAGAWNKPHPSTYSDFRVLALDDQGHIVNHGFGVLNPSNIIEYVNVGLYFQHDEEQQKRFGMMCRCSRRLQLNEWSRIDATITLARHNPEQSAVALLQALQLQRPEDHYLYEKDCQQALTIASLEKTAGKLVVLS